MNQNSALNLLQKQRSHILVVLSHPQAGRESTFRSWYSGEYRKAVINAGVLSARHYEQHEVDITRGRWPRLSFQYLALYELSVDGAEAASGQIDGIQQLHAQEPSAKPCATWLYYPACEKVGRAPKSQPSLLTVAFANGLAGKEGEFREWYATRHIRHAMNIAAFVSGQCLERTQFQNPGALEAKFNTIALYEQEGTPESILQSFASLPPGTLTFPALDVDPSRFSESVYRPV